MKVHKGGLIMLFVWISLGLIIYFVLFKDSKSSSTLTAEEILKQRYVSGEIDATQYNQMKSTLRK